GRVLSLLQDNVVHYNGQPIAVVVADTFEHAVAAAELIKVRYREERPELDFERAKGSAYARKQMPQGEAAVAWGDADKALAASPVRIEQTYATPMETHNPMEPHATIAAWDGDRLTLYDSTQFISGVRDTVAKTLGIAPERVRVVSPFVGGGFGCKGSTWSHVVLAAIAAQRAGRPVRLANYAEADPRTGKPWSSKMLRECYTDGAARFGWAKRPMKPRAMRDGHALIGWGMATATYPAHRRPASAVARILPDGTALVRSGTHDLGTGTYTVMTQVAADALGLPLDKIDFELGDTLMPPAGVSGGSTTVASVAPAVKAACEAARAKKQAAIAAGRPNEVIEAQA